MQKISLILYQVFVPEIHNKNKKFGTTFEVKHKRIITTNYYVIKYNTPHLTN